MVQGNRVGSAEGVALPLELHLRGRERVFVLDLVQGSGFRVQS